MLGNLPAAHLHGVLSWLSTHPNSDERIKSVQQFLDEAAPRKYSPIDFRLEELRELPGNGQNEEPKDAEEAGNNDDTKVANDRPSGKVPNIETDVEDEARSQD